MQFIQATEQEVTQYARTLFADNIDKWKSFEEVTDFIVNQIYKDFVNESDQKIFELVRIFRMVQSDNLPPEGLEDVPESPEWLALVATAGREDAWNSRLTSAGHRLLPSAAFTTPMLKAAFEQIGLNQEHTTEDFMKSAGLMANFFHVEHAPDSPYIVAQDEFVKPYGIKSVVGIGSPFIGGSMYMLLGFASTKLDKEIAEKVSNLALFIGTLLSNYEESERPIWKSA